MTQLLTALDWMNSQNKYDSVQLEVKELIAALFDRAILHLQKKTEELARKVIEEHIGTPGQQKEAVKQVTLNTLSTLPAETLIRNVVESYLRELKIPQTLKELEDSSTTNSYVPAYHSASEIRDIIKEHLAEIQDYFGTREVSLSALCDHLQRYTTLRSDDHVIKGNGGKRWNQQVGNALNTSIWKDCPIVRAHIRGHYIVTPQQ